MSLAGEGRQTPGWQSPTTDQDCRSYARARDSRRTDRCPGAFSTVAFALGVTGKPVCKLATVLICQPPSECEAGPSFAHRLLRPEEARTRRLPPSCAGHPKAWGRRMEC